MANIIGIWRPAPPVDRAVGGQERATKLREEPWLTDWITAAFGWCDRRRGVGTLFLLLLPVFVLLLPPIGWHPNEENYFMLAHRSVAPERFSDFSAAFDRSHARFVNEWLVGHAVLWFGYEAAHAVLRSVMAALYAACFALLLRSLRLSLSDGLLALALFQLLGQQGLMGNEWLFGAVEAKTFAYALVFAGLAMVVERRWLPAALAAVAATYFHFLVGGFWTLVLLGLFLALHRDPRQASAFAALYGVLILPLAGVVITDQLGNATPPAEGRPSPDFIYSILRNPHHVAPMADPNRGHWFWGGLSTSALCLTFVTLAQLSARPVRVLAWTVAALSAYLLAAFALSLLDAETGALGKFYPFRPSSLSLLLALLTAILFLRSSNEPPTARMLASVMAVPLFLAASFGLTLKDLAEKGAALGEMRELAGAVQERTAPGDLVLLQPSPNGRQPIRLPTAPARPADPGELEVRADQPGGYPTLVRPRAVPQAPVQARLHGAAAGIPDPLPHRGGKGSSCSGPVVR